MQIGKLDRKVIDKNIDKIKEADIILMQLEIPLDTIEYICGIASDKILILDPAPATNKIADNMLSKINIIKPNETELSILTNLPTTNLEEIKIAGQQLLSRGVQNVIVSLGEKGAILINKEKTQIFPSIKNKVVDTTAAGDSFIAAITLAISKNKTIEESIEFGNKVASFTVGKKGAQKSIPSLEELV